MLQIAIASFGALLGVVFMFFSLRDNAKAKKWSIQRLTSWLLIGGLVGAFGSHVLMFPLQYCTFDEGRSPLELYYGYALIVMSVAIVIIPFQWFARYGWAGSNSSESTQGMFHNWWMPWLLLLPTLLILVFFLYNPFLDTFRLSTLLASRNRTAFICLKNFADIAVDPEYLMTVARTFNFAFLILAGGLSAGLGIALLAYQPITGAGIYRTLLVWPHAISPVVAGVIFRLMFNPNGGVINYFTQALFGVRFDWLNTPVLAAVVVVMASIWTQLGFNLLFFLAGLQSIPKDLLESAAIDGANAWQRFWSITLPLLSPIFFFLVITNMTFSFFDIFGTIDYLTAGGPLDATTVMIYRVFETQQDNLGLGRAAAQSIVLFFVVVGLTFLQFRTSERQVNYGA